MAMVLIVKSVLWRLLNLSVERGIQLQSHMVAIKNCERKPWKQSMFLLSFGGPPLATKHLKRTQSIHKHFQIFREQVLYKL